VTDPALPNAVAPSADGLPRRAIPAPTTTDERAALDLKGIPVVAIVGSCMNCGKTAAACAMVREFAHQGLRIDGLKATGVSLRRDILALEDAGARATAIFTDLGVVSTTAANSAQATRMLLSRLAAQNADAAHRPDLIVLERGDGLPGAYGVDAILGHIHLHPGTSCVACHYQLLACRSQLHWVAGHAQSSR